VLRPVLRFALPKSGICGNFPRVVLYGPKKYQGLGQVHPFAQQVTAHIFGCMRHGGSTDTLNGQFLHACLEAHQSEIGVPDGIPQLDFESFGIAASDTWIKKVWAELDGIGYHLSYRQAALPLPV
jgi:hypothetical protein